MQKTSLETTSLAIPLKIGITGGIGSGKTTVSKIFEILGIPVYYADNRAKSIMEQEGEVKNRINRLFGKEAYFQNGGLNRKYIAGVVFQDKTKLEKLNAIVHPAVIKDGEAWFAEQHGTPYCLKEAALLIESGSYKTLDALIVVTAPQPLRIERVMKRDGLKKTDVIARLKSQGPEEEKLRLADFVIQNDGSQSLIKQVLETHQQIVSTWAKALKNN
ncbi:MAG: dephospho-CoA kinase [Saprospiraceae bacterium]|nr:dephospho-CoA kinase [Saprospiraceae bacterium]